MSKLFKNRNVRKKQTNWQVLVYCKSKKSCLNLCSESPYKMLQYFVNIRYHLNHYVFLSYSLEAQLLVNQPSSHSQPGPGLIRTRTRTDQDWPGLTWTDQDWPGLTRTDQNQERDQDWQGMTKTDQNRPGLTKEY